SSLPGCSPTKTTSARRAPSPNTVWVPSSQRSQPLQSAAASRKADKLLRLGKKSSADVSGLSWDMNHSDELVITIMKQAITKAQIAAEIGSHFGTVFQYDEQPQPQVLSTGLALFDKVTSRGFPRGAITEIWGSQSSGRISVMLSALAYAAGNAEICALVDVNDSFDLQCANTARIQFERLLWVRCS